MSGVRRRDDHIAIEIEAIRRALGAVAAAEPAVFWICRRQREWWVRQEGSASERRFASRAAAEAHVELLAARCRSWRLFIEAEAGGFTEDHGGWPAAMRRQVAEEDGTPSDLS
jgi:hypothetical protein